MILRPSIVALAGFLAVSFCAAPVLAAGDATTTTTTNSSLSLIDAVAAMPSCAVGCVTQFLPTTSCAVTNSTCLCSDTELWKNLENCVQANCTLEQALFTRNLSATACDEPIRDRSTTYSTVSTSFCSVSGGMLIARTAYKIFGLGDGLAPDDWMAIATYSIGIFGCTVNVYGLAANGFGRDIWTVPLDQIVSYARFFYFMELEYYIQVPMLKLALLLFYLRIFPFRTIKRLLWATFGFNVLVLVSLTLAAAFQCAPIDYFWTRYEGGKGHCIDGNAIAWSNAAFSIVTDIWMLAIPLSQLPHLSLHWKKKIGVALMFCVGTFVTVVSVIRLQSLLRFSNSTNPTWDNFDTAIWSTVEVNVGIMCLCMPAMRVILVRLFPRFLGSNSSSNRGAYGPEGGSNVKFHGPATGGKAGGPRSSSRVAHGESGGGGGGSGGKGIVFSRSYTVEYDRHSNDEESLVHMKDLDRASAKAASEESLHVSRV